MDIKIGDVVLASGLPVLEAIIMCLFGACVVWKDIIRPEDWRVLTKLMYFVFFPCLVVSALGSSATAATLLSWWPLPASTLLNVVLGMLLGAAAFPFVGMPADLRPHFISCAGVGSLGNLLIVLVPSIATKSSLFTDKDAEQGLAYVFGALFAICIAAFTIVGALLAHPRAPVDTASDCNAPNDKLPPPSSCDIHMHELTGDGATPSPFHCVGEPAGSFSIRHSRELERRSAQSMYGMHAVHSSQASHIAAAGTVPPNRLHNPQDTTIRGASRPPTLVSALFASHYYSQRLTLDGMSAHTAHSTDHSTSPSIHSQQHPELTATEAQHAITNPVYEDTASDSHSSAPKAMSIPVESSHDCKTFSSAAAGLPGSIFRLSSIEEGPSSMHLASEGSGTDVCEPVLVALRSHPAAELSTQLGVLDLDSQFSAPRGSIRAPSPNDAVVVTAGSSGLIPALKAGGEPPTDKSKQWCFSTGSASIAHAEELCEQQSFREVVMCRVRGMWALVKGWMNMPTMAIFVGLVVACTPPLQRLFYGPDEEPEDGEDVVKGQLDVVTSALRRVGAAAIPCMMVSLGGALSKGPGDSKVSTKAVVALVAIRLLILPAAGGWAVLAGQNAGLWEDNGKMFTLVLMLQHAMPTAVNVHAVAAMNGNHEKVVAALLFWQYIACIVTIPVCVLAFLSQISA